MTSTSASKILPKALLITCIDYRIVDLVHQKMKDLGYQNDYDLLTMAGASLGPLNPTHLLWSVTFWEHLSMVIQYHDIKKVIVIDHRDCKAYQVAFNREFINRQEETQMHRRNVAALYYQLSILHPEIEFEAYLLDLDGTLEHLGV